MTQVNRKAWRNGFVLLATSTLALGGISAEKARAQSMEQLAKPQQGRSMRATSAARLPNGEFDPNSNADRLASLPPGQTQVLMEAQGPGVITHIWTTFLGPDPHQWAPGGSANHQEMLLRIFYDGDERPGVEAPVGDFFANCFGQRSEVISMPVVVEDADSYNCFWRMPFRKSVRVEIVNQSEKPISRLYYNIDWIKLNTLTEDAPYFYAQYRQEYPVEKGKDYVLLDTQGKGHYVGTVLAVRMRSPAWFGEGDEKIYIDGEGKPSIWGTGTEDYFLSAWGLKQTITPYFGTPFFDRRGVGGHTSAYRWHINDPIVFQKGIKVTIEHFGWMSADENPKYETNSWNEREDDYSSVAFWYQAGKPTFTARAPDARARTLPSLERTVVNIADTDFRKHHGSGEIRLQRRGRSGPSPALYRPTAPDGAWIEIPFQVKEKEPLRLVLRMTRSYDFGRYQASLNGVKLGEPLDFYRAETDTWEYHLLDFWPEPGEYTLRLDCIDKNSASTGYGLAMESVCLRERRPRVKEWAHDKDKDWKANPTIYR